MAGTLPCRLLLDQGGHSLRGRLLAPDGALLRSEQVGLDPAADPDPAVLASALQELIDALVAEAAADVPIEAALATERASVLAWDAQTRQPLSPLLRWNRHASAWLPGLTADEAGRLRASTGLRLSSHYGAPKLAALYRSRPDLRALAAAGRLRLGPLAGWLVAALTGDDGVDETTAARTLLLDVRRGEWAPSLVTAFGLPRSALPEVRAPGAGFGTLAAGGRRVPLRLLIGDQSAAVHAAGTAVLNLGSGAFLLRPLADFTTAPGLLTTGLGEVDGRRRFALEATVNGAANALDTVAAASGVALGSELLAAALAEREGVPLFLNCEGGLGAPWWRADARSRWLGEAADLPRRLRAVLESLVFLVRVNVEAMVVAAGPIARLCIGGGLSAVAGLAQLLADGLGRTVEIARDPELTLQGLAALTGGPEAAGFDARRPRPDAVLEARFQRWYRAMVEAFGPPESALPDPTS
ncbi:FGGY family carbohydrate kinase [Thiohalobacter sp.]|uniref:FGGY family carbohydrate kinase n=1 Tax=Thiohalobacter sp. TaxID=2025948 RepID=UPI0026198267|nr:FGGY family carbohydrate kinase [Thiohalobacter sp.]